MIKLVKNRRHLLIKCWLLAIAYQTGLSSATSQSGFDDDTSEWQTELNQEFLQSDPHFADHLEHEQIYTDFSHTPYNTLQEDKPAIFIISSQEPAERYLSDTPVQPADLSDEIIKIADEPRDSPFKQVFAQAYEHFKKNDSVSDFNQENRSPPQDNQGTSPIIPSFVVSNFTSDEPTSPSEPSLKQPVSQYSKDSPNFTQENLSPPQDNQETPSLIPSFVVSNFTSDEPTPPSEPSPEQPVSQYSKDSPASQEQQFKDRKWLWNSKPTLKARSNGSKKATTSSPEKLVEIRPVRADDHPNDIAQTTAQENGASQIPTISPTAPLTQGENPPAINEKTLESEGGSPEVTRIQSFPRETEPSSQAVAPPAPTNNAEASPPPQNHTQTKPNSEVSINFNNVSMIEYIRFISRISNKNFIFDDQDLQFNVTIISEEATTVENLMAALLQELRIRNLNLIEQGNNIIIHTNMKVRSPAHIEVEGSQTKKSNAEIVTRVFRLNTLDPLKASEILRPLLSDEALVEVLRDTNNMIITDLTVNVNKAAELIQNLDAPYTGVTVGQYVVRNGFAEPLVLLANQILAPIAQGNPYVLVPHAATNSIYVVSNTFIVEKALAILENLDLNEGRTKILSLDRLQLREPAEVNVGPAGAPGMGGGTNPNATMGPNGAASTTNASAGGISTQPHGFINGNAAMPGGIFPSSTSAGGVQAGGNAGQPSELYPPSSQYNIPGTPEYNPNLPPSYPFGTPGGVNLPSTPVFNPNEALAPVFGPGGIGTEGRPGIFESREFAGGGISSHPRWVQGLPTGHIERTLFYIYKLKYRKGDQIELALRHIAESLRSTGSANADIVAAIRSSQLIEASNSLIFTGTYEALERIKELITEVDLPLRQVFIELLILDTTVTDALTYGVDWGSRFGGGNTVGGQSFLGLGSNLDAVLNAGTTAAGVNNITPVNRGTSTNGLLNAAGYSAGVIGRHLTHGGLQFNTIGALVEALYTDTSTNIIMNPKIVTEDNNPAEVFVGSTQRYKTQSVTNDIGAVLTNNFQFIDVGSTFRVTPQIGNNGIITLEIVQENTASNPAANATSNNPGAVDVNLVPILNKSRTTTRIHVPDGFFVVFSGMISDTETDTVSRIPCLGGIPIIGGVSKQKGKSDSKRNLMLFIRPLIVDSEEELENITKRQQDVYREKNKHRRTWNYEIDEALDFLNIKSTNPNDYCPTK